MAESASEKGMARLARALGKPRARSVSEDEVQFGGSPIDELRRTVNMRAYTPEQAAANREASLWELLSVLPGPGNVISGYDAYTGAGDAAEAFGEGDYAGAAISGGLAGLSALGAGLGLPVGKFAKGAAEAGADSLYAIPAWHGSPHDFDEFKLDKIGTGEGAQAYGRGLYFAQNPKVAEQYQTGLSPFLIDGKDSNSASFAVQQYAGMKLSGDLDAKIAQAEKEIANLEQTRLRPDISENPNTLATVDNMIAGQQEQLAIMKEVNARDVQSAGKLYHTELDVEPEDLLDWDKPLSQQGEIGKKALAVFERLGISQDGRWKPDTLAEIKQLATEKYGGDSFYAASQALREAGIPGISYLDQGSRGAGQGSSNYVIFDDSLVKILDKK